jgi:hypothetical protein
MAQISETDSYGFKRCEEEIKYLSEDSEYYHKITKREIQWKNFQESAYKNSFLFRDYTLKRLIRKGMQIRTNKKGLQ